jgi:hypothetical protein
VAGRPRHQDKDIENVLQSLERQDWRVTKAKGYYKAYCPCAKKHMKTIHLTPSTSGYRRNLMGQLKRATCWDEEA